MSPALQEEFLTPGPPGKPIRQTISTLFLLVLILWAKLDACSLDLLSRDFSGTSLEHQPCVLNPTLPSSLVPSLIFLEHRVHGMFIF